jgi:hypothetical protein
MPPSLALSFHLPWRTSTLSVAVPRGLIGVVSNLRPGWDPASSAVSNVTFWAVEDWLETMRTIGPAPNRCGETLMREFVIAAVTLIGAGGRGLFA